MPKTPKIPTLGAVAAAQDDEKAKKKARGMLASLAALLGIGDAKPGAKMTKKTLTTKRVEMEESDEEEESGSTGSEEEEEEMSTGSTGSDGGSTGSTHDSESEEEEEEEERSAKRGESEEEEEKALARAVGKALNSPSVHAAFLAALPAKHRDAGAIFSPHRLAALAKKSTGQAKTYGAMMALADGVKANKAATEKVLTKQAALETRVAKVEGARRKDRVAAIVSVAKEKGVAGATTKEGRAMLREYGMAHGATKLSAWIAAQPIAAPTGEKLPGANADGSTRGGPSADEQEKAMLQATFGDLKGKDYDDAVALYQKNKALNGAGKAEA